MKKAGGKEQRMFLALVGLCHLSFTANSESQISACAA